MTAPRRLALLLVPVLAALAGCAGGDPEGGAVVDRGGPAHGPQRPLPNTFISPAGEPYRAAAGTPYPVAAWFAHANVAHDGKLTRAEFDADALAFFRRLDENHDGVLDGLEVQDYEQKVAPEILPQVESLRANEGMDASLTFDAEGDAENQRNHRSSGLGRARPLAPKSVGVQGAGVYSMLNSPEPVAAADTRFDGRITAQEFQAVVDARFDALDKAGLGYLTLDALPKTPVQELIDKRAKALAKRCKAHPKSEGCSGAGAAPSRATSPEATP